MALVRSSKASGKVVMNDGHIEETNLISVEFKISNAGTHGLMHKCTGMLPIW